jgi:aryl-phospho-beta-D-glucosidase BglC (GH1 family)
LDGDLRQYPQPMGKLISVLTLLCLLACGSSSSQGAPVTDDGGGGTTGGGTTGGGTTGGGTTGGGTTSGGTTGPGLPASGGLHAVMGTNGHAGHIEDGNGHVVVLHGVNESGTENFCLTWGPPPIVLSPAGGPSPLNQASLTAMKSWGLNAVRIPLNEDCWLGINGVASSVGGANYQNPILDAVNLITKTNSMYAILDLHITAAGSNKALKQAPMPDVDHSITFWQQVAAAYKDNGSVIFDLFNEPNTAPGTPDQQYACWKDGSTAPSSGSCPMINFAVAGMQTLVDTVRQAGANNLLILGGRGVSGFLDLWPKYVPTDTLSPPNLAASWHVYDDQGGCTTNWANSLNYMCTAGTGLGASAAIDAGYPIVIGETGYYSCSAAGVGAAWWPFFLSWADSQGLSYLAWSWSTGNTPHLLSDATNFTPGANGPTYKTYLSCIAGKTVTPATSCTFVPTTGCE